MMTNRISLAALPLAAALAAGLSAIPAPAAAAETCEGSSGPGKAKLVLEATNLRSAKGEVAFTIYANDRKRFLAKGGKLARVRTATVRPLTRACFWLPAGTYAAALYHDENGDHDFNRTLFVPKEGFGFSNDAPTTLGLPTLAATAFRLPAAGTTMRIRMRYQR